MSNENEELQPDPEEILPSFQPIQISAEELEQIRDLIKYGSPEQAAQAQERLVEASLGGSSEAIRAALRTSIELKAALRARAAGEQFAAIHQEYKQCPENARTIVAYLQRNHLAPTVRSMEVAYNALRAEGKIILNEPDEEPQPPKPIETGRGNLDGGLLALPDSEFVAAVEKMPSDVYKGYFLNSPAFRQRVEDLHKSRGN